MIICGPPYFPAMILLRAKFGFARSKGGGLLGAKSGENHTVMMTDSYRMQMKMQTKLKKQLDLTKFCHI